MNPLTRCILRIEQFFGLLKIAVRSIQQRALASALTAIAMGLGVALVVTVLVIHAVIAQSFNRWARGYELIVGNKQGSAWELVLNVAYYVDVPNANIPYDYYLEFTEKGLYGLDVEKAVPISLGHSYGSYPVVGTTPDMFDLEYSSDKRYEFVPGSSCFKPEGLFEAVAGATVAGREGWNVGATFQAVHGTAEKGGEKHEQEFKVVGILQPTGTPNDRAIFVNLRAFSALHSEESGHDEHEHEHEHELTTKEPEEITAILVCVDRNQPFGARSLADLVNKDDESVAQAAIPGDEIDKFLTNIVGDVELVLLIMAVLIVVVAGIGIMVSIYNSMSDRRREIAIMRALGASRLTVMLVILMESILLSLGGGLLGLLLGHGLIALLSPVIVEHTRVAVGLLHFRPVELILIPGLIVLASLVGYLPAVAAYRTDVSASLGK